MTTESTTKKPETKVDNSPIKENIKDPQPSKTMIDDEDEFEDFAVNGILLTLVRMHNKKIIKKKKKV